MRPKRRRQKRKWQDGDKQVMEDASLLPFTYDKALNYRNPRVTNVYVHPAWGMDDFQALGVQ